MDKTDGFLRYLERHKCVKKCLQVFSKSLVVVNRFLLNKVQVKDESFLKSTFHCN